MTHTMGKLRNPSRRHFMSACLPMLGSVSLSRSHSRILVGPSRKGHATTHQLQNLAFDREVYRSIWSEKQLPPAVRLCAHNKFVEHSCLLAFNGDNTARELLEIAYEHPRFRSNVLQVLKCHVRGADEWQWHSSDQAKGRSEMFELVERALRVRYPTDVALVAEVQRHQLDEALSGVDEWVGHFWLMQDEGGRRILADRVPLADAHNRDGLLISPRCPIAIWLRWQKLGYLGIRAVKLSRRVIRNDPHHFKRGRVDYCFRRKKFLVVSHDVELSSELFAQVRELFFPSVRVSDAWDHKSLMRPPFPNNRTRGSDPLA